MKNEKHVEVLNGRVEEVFEREMIVYTKEYLSGVIYDCDSPFLESGDSIRVIVKKLSVTGEPIYALWKGDQK